MGHKQNRFLLEMLRSPQQSPPYISAAILGDMVTPKLQLSLGIHKNLVPALGCGEHQHPQILKSPLGDGVGPCIRSPLDLQTPGCREQYRH